MLWCKWDGIRYFSIAFPYFSDGHKAALCFRTILINWNNSYKFWEVSWMEEGLHCYAFWPQIPFEIKWERHFSFLVDPGYLVDVNQVWRSFPSALNLSSWIFLNCCLKFSVPSERVRQRWSIGSHASKRTGGLTLGNAACLSLSFIFYFSWMAVFKAHEYCCCK